MQNGTSQTRETSETGRALVPVTAAEPRFARGNAPASFLAQLLDTRFGTWRPRRVGSEQAVRRYGAADALATAKTSSRFERVV